MAQWRRAFAAFPDPTFSAPTAEGSQPPAAPGTQGPNGWGAPLGQKDWALPVTSGFLCLLPPPPAASVPTGLLAVTSSAGGTEQVSWCSLGSSGVEEGMRAPRAGQDSPASVAAGLDYS